MNNLPTFDELCVKVREKVASMSYLQRVIYEKGFSINLHTLDIGHIPTMNHPDYFNITEPLTDRIVEEIAQAHLTFLRVYNDEH
jgi:hypothetical protein